MRPRVLVLGTGALACFFGARLGRSGRAQVTLVGSWLEALAAIAARGVRVLEGDGSWSIALDALPTSAPLPQADFVIVLVKSHQTASLASLVAGSLSPDGLVITLQNGLDNVEVLRSAVGSDRVIQGVAFLGATMLAPGLVRAFPGRVVLEARGALVTRVQDFAFLLSQSGFIGEISGDIRPIVWRKLAANCAINPLTAIFRVPNGVLIDHPEARCLLEAAAREVGDVATAAGVPLGEDAVEIALSVALQTAGNRSSMLQDVDRGAPTEIDALNGAVVRHGQALGVPTPVNEMLVAQVRAMEPHRTDAVSWAGRPS